EAVSGSGTFVSRQLSAANPHTSDSPIETALMTGPNPMGLSRFGSSLMDTPIARSTSGDLPGLNYGSPPVDLLPTVKWRELLLNYCRLKAPAQWDYGTEIFGHRPLRETVASYLSRSKGVNCSADRLIVFEGSQNALAHITRLLVDSGD